MARQNDPVVEEPTTAEYVAKNRLKEQDAPIHSWYRFVLSYPPHFVREWVEAFGADPERDWVLDPFSGTATTPVEARLLCFRTLSLDANPISVLATRVKLNWDINAETLDRMLDRILALASAALERYDLQPFGSASSQLLLFEPAKRTVKDPEVARKARAFSPEALLPEASCALIPRGFISEKPLLRTLAVRFAIEQECEKPEVRDFFLLALANTIVSTAGNVGFGPEVYRKAPKDDADVLGSFASTVGAMVCDLRDVLARLRHPLPEFHVFDDDARELTALAHAPPAGVVITSPPYPNEKDYTRATRLESVLLGLVKTKAQLRKLKSRLLRSNTRNVFAGDDDDEHVADIPAVVSLADAIEARRRELGKTSGFERQYHRVVRLYFGGMWRHLAALMERLRPGARCAYLVGDQMSFFRIHIATARVLADIATRLGYFVEGISLWRTRRATATGENLEENVLILRKP